MSFPNDTSSMYAAEHHTSGAAAVLQHNFLHLHQQPSEASSAAGPHHHHHHHHQWGPPPPAAEEEEGASTAGVEQVQEGTWQNARYKSEILAHPLYEQLLAAHVACLRIATPVDQLPRIDEQLARSQGVVGKYSVLGAGDDNHMLVTDEKELDQFMVGESVHPIIFHFLNF